MKEGIQRIDNLEEHLSENRGDHVIYTGTFDPFHDGHLHVVLQALNIRNVREEQNPVLLFPHNRTLHKTPSPIERRIAWMEQSLLAESEEMPVRENIAIVSDPSILYDRDEWHRLKEKFRDRLIRVVGDDKSDHVKDPNLIVIDRVPNISSSEIRAIVRSLSLERIEGLGEEGRFKGINAEVARAILATKVYEE
ncbi:hypothetical protein HN709_01725 [Candidatus Peregrinibacteria bacterium]|jgi:hypothetical protein|nr:hypothetical protein [Candidatus Peregrinibacteria bacterium]MBT7736382.1 hypothetical protein [Candidatus Peregrinibacteria bacterium]